MAPTFGIPGSVVFDMEMRGGPLPSDVRAPNDLAATVRISCTGQQARVIEAWLRDHAEESTDPQQYRGCADLISRALSEAT